MPLDVGSRLRTGRRSTPDSHTCVHAFAVTKQNSCRNTKPSRRKLRRSEGRGVPDKTWEADTHRAQKQVQVLENFSIAIVLQLFGQVFNIFLELHAIQIFQCWIYLGKQKEDARNSQTVVYYD
eukprot:g47526.t1